MLNKRLIGLLPGIGARTARAVFFNWLALICSSAVTVCICFFLSSLLLGDTGAARLAPAAAAAAVCIAARTVFIRLHKETAAQTARDVKKILRGRIFDRICSLGASYRSSVSTAEAVQVGIEGIEQLEAYFSQYLPQLFYALAATVTLFVFFCFISIKAAVVLIICVPLIPLAIIGVQKLAKKLLSKYWDSYTELGDSFLENIRGLTTLKIYQCDGAKHREMNENAERFRKATMRVLIMQLNSISIMDIVAYGGAAAGIITAVSELSSSRISFFQTMVIILLSAEFFLPLRRLGSYFHVAMNGASAADRIFKILSAERERQPGTEHITGTGIELRDMCFSYDGKTPVLSRINMTLPQKGLFAIVGKSGCGKSTIAGIISGSLKGYTGSIKIGHTELESAADTELSGNITLVTHDSYIFKGTVRYNLLLGCGTADDEQMRTALRRARLLDFIDESGGLDTVIAEQGSNLSGGQRQRLALARAILRDTPVMIFDEAASNIDVESENYINEVIAELAEEKLVIVISHRLAAVTRADMIFLLSEGRIAEAGTHEELMKKERLYAEMFTAQRELELHGSGGDNFE